MSSSNILSHASSNVIFIWMMREKVQLRSNVTYTLRGVGGNNSTKFFGHKSRTFSNKSQYIWFVFNYPNSALDKMDTIFKLQLLAMSWNHNSNRLAKGKLASGSTYIYFMCCLIVCICAIIYILSRCIHWPSFSNFSLFIVHQDLVELLHPV